MAEAAVTIPFTPEAAALAPGQEIPAEAPQSQDMAPNGVTPQVAAAPEGTPAKFVNADGSLNHAALVESYKHLESKVGGAEDTPATEAAPAEAGTASYGEMVDGIMTKAGLTPQGVDAEWRQSGTLSEDTMAKLEASGLGRDLVKQYIQGANAQAKTGAADAQLATARDKEVMDSVGGADAYGRMAEWASTNLQQAEIDAFDQAVSSGNPAMVDIAVAGLNAKFQQAEGSVGKLALGGNASGSTDVFGSAEELANAANAARMSGDPAQIQAYEQKALRSSVF